MDIPTSSISNEIEKSIREEFSVSQAAIEEIRKRREKGQKPESISNEEIRKGDPILNTYKVLDDAIHGGMGSVWRVHHESWNVDLAMKRPQPRFFAEAGDGRKEEFIRECENWINLGLHPNIVSCYYVREIGGVPTIFSEWMDNGSLKDCIKDGSLYEGTEEEVQERILDIAIQTARGLKYSHENGLIHQDVKPGNILLTKGWDAKVADFGLAKAQSQLTENEKPVSTGYTIQYCPREQAEGAPAKKWMDVYAWALTVLEMYAGKRLWETGAEVKDHYKDFYRQCRISLSAALQKLIAQCLTSVAVDFSGIPETLSEIYNELCGVKYAVKESKAASDTAASLNNKALSFLDLGMPKFAEDFWKQALTVEPNHVDALFNRELYLLRSGRKFDFEVLRELENNSAVKEAGAVEAIRRECHGCVSLKQVSVPTADKIFPSTAVKDHSLYLLNKTNILSLSLKDFDLLPDAQNSAGSNVCAELFCEIKIPGKKISKIVLREDMEQAAILMDLTENSAELALYDPWKQQITRTCTLALNGHGRIPRENRLYLNYTQDHSTLVFLSPDGRLCTLVDTEMLTVLSETDTETETKLFLQLPDSNILLFSCTSPANPRPLYLFGRNTPLKEVFRLKNSRRTSIGASLVGNSCQNSVIIWGNYSEQERFRLDDQFQQTEDDDSAYTQALKGAFFVDQVRGLLYSSISKYDRTLNLKEDYCCICDIRQKRCLYSIPSPGYFLTAVPDQNNNCLLVFSNLVIYTEKDTRLTVLKAFTPDENEEASWRVSHILTVQARFEEEERLAKLQEQFYSAIKKKKYDEALSVLYECRGIPGFSTGEECCRMEDMLEPVAERTKITGAYRIDTLKKLPDYAVTQMVYKKQTNTGTRLVSNVYSQNFMTTQMPAYTKAQGWAASPQTVLCADGKAVVVGDAFVGESYRRHIVKRVQIYSPNWELIRTFQLPAYTVKAFVRNGRIYAVTKILDCAVFSLEGELLQTSKTENFLESITVQEKNRYNRARSVNVVDMSIDGNRILFRMTGDDLYDPYHIYPEDGAFYHKDLITGHMLRLGESKNLLKQHVSYLCDGSILQYGELDPERGLIPACSKLLRQSPKDGSILQTYTLESNTEYLDVRFNYFILNEARDCFLMKMFNSLAFDIYQYRYCLFHMDGTLLQQGEIIGAGDDIALPDGHILRFLRNGNLFDILHNSETTLKETDHVSLLDAAFRPDGRELYLKVTGTDDEWNKARGEYVYRWRRYHLEYEYKLKDGLKLPNSEPDKASNSQKNSRRKLAVKPESPSGEKSTDMPKKGWFARLFGK